MESWIDKRIIVTGGGGFIGSHVVDVLREQGAQHITVVRSRDYDLTREAEVTRLYETIRPQVVFHLAGLVGGILANRERPAEFFYQNLMMGTLMTHYAWKYGVERFAAAGAGCGYPEHAPVPLQETSFWDGLPQPDSAPYSLAKRLLSVQSQAYYRQHGFVTVIGIPGNVYGPRDNFDLHQSHVVPALVRKFVEAADEGAQEVVVWGNGAPTRDFVYVQDVARGLILAAGTYERPEIVNLSSGQETSIRGVVQTLARITGFSGRIRWDTSRPGGQQRRLFDTTKAQRDLGFQAAVTLEDGLRQTVEWYRAHQPAPAPTH